MTTQRDELLADLFTTALEGGINYWSQCAAYHWSDEGEPDVLGFYADVIEVEAENEPCHTVDRSVMSRGYALAASEWRDKLCWSTEPPPFVVTEESRDDWDYDAGDADMILQLGLFGDVRYG